MEGHAMDNCYFKRAFDHSPSQWAKQLPFYVNRLGWRACEPGIGQKRAAGDYYGYELLYVLRGGGYVRTKASPARLQPGDLFFIDLSAEHEFAADLEDPWEMIWISFDGTQAPLYFNMLYGGTPVFAAKEHPEIGQLFQQTYELFNSHPIDLDVRVCPLLLSLLTKLYTDTQHKTSVPSTSHMSQDQINKTIAYIENNFQAPLPLHELAQVAMLSPYHLCRVFKKQTGFTVKEYHLKCRLNQAKKLLAHTPFSITEIAGKVGFGDHSHFGRIFRKYEQMSPLQYRSIMYDDRRMK
jgi:AraC-like DNA-binding protein